MATAKKDGSNAAADTHTGTSSAQSALTKYRNPITISAIVAGGALALGAAFAGGVAVAHNDRPHFGNEAMGAPHNPEGDLKGLGERGEHGERGERGQHGARGETGEQPGMVGQPGMGGQPGSENAPAPTEGVAPTPAP